MIPIMRAMSDPRVRRVVTVCGAQMGKTEGFWNVIGWRLDDDPAPILYIGPTQKLVESMSSDRVMKMLQSVPTLWDKLAKGKKNKITEKFIAGVRLGFAWAGSATEIAGHPAALVLIDERDRMDSDVGGEGDVVELGEARMSTYPDGRLAVVSTPTGGPSEVYVDEVTGVEHWKVSDAVTSPVWRLWQEGSRHEWAIPCAHCGDYYVPRLRHLRWPKDCAPAAAVRAARLVCRHCGAENDGVQVHRANASGRYVAPGQRVTRDGVVEGPEPTGDVRSYWISGLCSPWRTIGQRARDYIAAARGNDPDRMRAVVNTRFGELFVERGEVPTVDRVLAARRAYRMGEVPEGAIVLTAGVDVQKTRLVYVVRAWGRGLASWLVDFGELWGDTERPEVWSALGDLLAKLYGEKRWAVRMMLVDSGYLPSQVYEFCRHHPAALPSKGRDELSMPVSMSRIEVTHKGEKVRRGQVLWHIDTGHFKALVHSRIEWPADRPGAWALPEDVPDEWAAQVTAESRVMLPSGRAVWRRHSPQNHALDCEVYAAAAARILGIDRLAPEAPASVPAPAQEAAPAPIPPTAPAAVRRPLLAPPVRLRGPMRGIGW